MSDLTERTIRRIAAHHSTMAHADNQGRLYIAIQCWDSVTRTLITEWEHVSTQREALIALGY